MTGVRLDDSIFILTRGYDFGARIWRRVHDGARSAPMRLLGKDALLVRGTAGVALFYDERRIVRQGAMPLIVQETLFGHGSVHSLDGDEHRHRKATFVDIAYEEAHVVRLNSLLEKEWQFELDSWAGGGRRTAYDAAVGALGRSIMQWAGMPGTPAARTRWAARLAQIVDGFGVPYSPEYLLAVANRRGSDRHARRLIEAVRKGELPAEEGTALHAWSWHRDWEGQLLPSRLAGIELQNSIRPAIAVSRFVAFAAKQLHDRPEWRERIAAETADRGTLLDSPLATAFAQEIRRTTPFVPMLPGWAITDVELDGERVRAGGRVRPRAIHRRRRLRDAPRLHPARRRGCRERSPLPRREAGDRRAHGRGCNAERSTRDYPRHRSRGESSAPSYQAGFRRSRAVDRRSIALSATLTSEFCTGISVNPYQRS